MWQYWTYNMDSDNLQWSSDACPMRVHLRGRIGTNCTNLARQPHKTHDYPPTYSLNTLYNLYEFCDCRKTLTRTMWLPSNPYHEQIQETLRIKRLMAIGITSTKLTRSRVRLAFSHETHNTLSATWAFHAEARYLWPVLRFTKPTEFHVDTKFSVVLYTCLRHSSMWSRMWRRLQLLEQNGHIKNTPLTVRIGAASCFITWRK